MTSSRWLTVFPGLAIVLKSLDLALVEPPVHTAKAGAHGETGQEGRVASLSHRINVEVSNASRHDERWRLHQ